MYGAAVIMGILLLLLSVVNPLRARAGVIPLRKTQAGRPARVHPYSQLLQSQPTSARPAKSSSDNQKLLVILVDFQEEIQDDPLTTGNGKFLFESDSTYLTTIASPPHNREYFIANLEALRYYYLAASQGLFDLQYDVYPADQTAYTLPNPMGYYSPPGASPDLFLARMEEYFKASFELADSLDPGIQFGQYGHFMIIHAGSDWQHDFFGDTPSDLPSFFIRAASGKEAVVDEGAVSIGYACNVPSTISQDFDTYTSGGLTYETGYGALNGVMAHEFGHSLGLVDLYSTYTFYPMVGSFDIMDSGGGGVTEDPAMPGVLVEGALPCLPGAFSRLVMFGEQFKEHGLLAETGHLLQDNAFSLSKQVAASSLKQDLSHPIPNLIKIPIGEDEYILLENRSVDPDGDGGTQIKGALDGRVVLHPVAFDDPTNAPTYEYDYLLPSFVDADYNAIGGGLLIWHVDEDLLFKQGRYDSEGNFISNFDNNTINSSYSHRGVRVIEADGLNDLGNEYSYFWTGTAYEYFHKYEAGLDQDGSFITWTTEIWRQEINSETDPALFTYEGHPSFYGLREIGQPSPVMNYRLSAGLFDNLCYLGMPDPSQTPLPIINSITEEQILPVLRNGSLSFHYYNPFDQLTNWPQIMAPLSVDLKFPEFAPIAADADNNGYTEVIVPHQDGIDIIQYNEDTPSVTSIGLQLSSSPLYALGELFVPALSGVSATTPARTGNYNIRPVNSLRLAATDSCLVELRQNQLRIWRPETGVIDEIYDLPESFGDYEPVSVEDINTGEHYHFLISNSGNIYKCHANLVEKILINPDSTELPTNLGVCRIGEYSPCLVFARGSKLLAINQVGTLLPGYPVAYHGFRAQPGSHLKIRLAPGAASETEGSIVYITLDNGNWLAVDGIYGINYAESVFSIKPGPYDQFSYQAGDEVSTWFFINRDNSLVAAERFDQETQPYVWSGFRDEGTGFKQIAFTQPQAHDSRFRAYVFPNPGRDRLATLRLENPEGLVEYNLYDISGKLLYKNQLQTQLENYRDQQIDISGLTSGVYLITVQNKGECRKVKFAVEK